MSIYLHDIPLPEAQAALFEALQSAGLNALLEAETIPLDEKANGRVLAAPIWAEISSPHYHASAMDGYAVRAAETASARPSQPLALVVLRDPEDAPQPFSAAYVDTGDPLPIWADAVIPIEQVEPVKTASVSSPGPRRPAAIHIREAVTPWSHVRPVGEDIVASQLVLPTGHTLRPVDLGAAAACGHTNLLVARRPRVVIIPTGDELAPIGRPVQAGNIIEYNSVVLAAQVAQWGGQALRQPIVPDELDLISRAVQESAQTADLVLLNAGSSAGSEDYSAAVVERLGRLLVHGVAVRPGHPVILGMLQLENRQIPIIGVPGYPVSAALTAEIFVAPLLERWLGRPAQQPLTVQASLTRKLTSPAGDDDFVRVALGMVNGKLLAAPLARGAGTITSLVRADGLALLPRGVQGMPAGALVDVRLYRSLDEIEQTILAIGSHDILLDLIAQHLTSRGRRLASSNVGSQGGLIALQRGEAHLAGSHLLDPQTGEYNLAAIGAYLPDMPIELVTLCRRVQGLMVKKGNPLGLHNLADLASGGVRFINRQRGAGTRVLLDYELAKIGVAAQEIAGYNQEEFTHLSVAAAIAAGRADCGLGIAAAAQALDLDFVPLFSERYDLVIPRQYVNSPLLTPLFEVLADPGFLREAARLPGYDLSETGKKYPRSHA